MLNPLTVSEKHGKHIMLRASFMDMANQIISNLLLVSRLLQGRRESLCRGHGGGVLNWCCPWYLCGWWLWHCRGGVGLCLALLWHCCEGLRTGTRQSRVRCSHRSCLALLQHHRGLSRKARQSTVTVGCSHRSLGLHCCPGLFDGGDFLLTRIVMLQLGWLLRSKISCDKGDMANFFVEYTRE